MTSITYDLPPSANVRLPSGFAFGFAASFDNRPFGRVGTGAVGLDGGHSIDVRRPGSQSGPRSSRIGSRSEIISSDAAVDVRIAHGHAMDCRNLHGMQDGRCAAASAARQSG